jgi:hypothetical protein
MTSYVRVFAPNYIATLNCLPMVPQLIGISWKCASQLSFHTHFWGGECGGLVYLHISHIWVLSAWAIFPTPGLGVCAPAGMRACVVLFWGVPPKPLHVSFMWMDGRKGVGAFSLQLQLLAYLLLQWAVKVLCAAKVLRAALPTQI